MYGKLAKMTAVDERVIDTVEMKRKNKRKATRPLMWEQTVWWAFVKDDDMTLCRKRTLRGLSVSRSRVASNAQSPSDSSSV
jgi:hypothetical protein